MKNCDHYFRTEDKKTGDEICESCGKKVLIFLKAYGYDKLTGLTWNKLEVKNG